MGLLSRLRRPASAVDGLPFAENRLASPVPVQRFASVAYALPEFQLGKAVWPAYDLRQSEGAYGKIALVFRCLSLVAHAAGTAPLRVYDEAQDDDEVPDHPLRRLVRQPNPNQGEALFWGTVALRTALAGYCVVEKERNALGGVIALNPLRSSRLKAIALGRGAYDWEYRVPGVSTVYRLAAADVVVFRWADAADGSPYGLSPLATLVRDVGILDKLTEFLGNLLDRGGVPMWMLIPDPDAVAMDQEELDDWTETFLRRRGGFDRRGVPWYAEGIKDAKQLSYNPEELALTAVRDISDLAICQAFGVPAHKAGTRVGLEHVKQNATAQVEDGAFYRDTIVPLWTRFDDAATTGLLPDFEPIPTTRYLGFDRSDIEALQEDRNAKATAIVVPGFAGGLLSNHMALRELGIPVPDGLPEYYLRSIAVDAIPADDPLQLATTTTTTTPPPAPPTTPPPQLGSLRIRELPGAPQGTLFLTPGPMRPGESLADYAKRCAVFKVDGPSHAFAKRKAIGAANRTAHIRIAQARKPSLAAFLRGQGERVIAEFERGRFTTTRPSTAFALNESFWQNEDTLLAAVLERLYLLAGQVSWDNAAEQVGVGLSFDLANPRVRAVMGQLAKRVTGITDTSRSLIADAVTKNAEQGGSLEDLKSSLKSMFGSWTEHRAEAVARTESMMSYGLASTAAYRESGVVDRIQCFDNPNHTDSYGAEDGLSCSQRDGLIDTLDSADLHLASEHVNGSLAIAPVLTGEE